MKIDGKPYRTIWLNDDGWSVEIIDQTLMPHRFETVTLRSLEEAARAIKTMQVGGAPLIGATAAYGVCLAVRNDDGYEALDLAWETLKSTRPTAVNLRCALDEMQGVLRNRPRGERAAAAYARAAAICDEDVAICQAIGRHGLKIIREIAATKADGEAVNILTHCNAGWLATVDWGTATAPMYMAFEEGIPLHVWTDRSEEHTSELQSLMRISYAVFRLK